MLGRRHVVHYAPMGCLVSEMRWSLFNSLITHDPQRALQHNYRQCRKNKSKHQERQHLMMKQTTNRLLKFTQPSTPAEQREKMTASPDEQ